jgi:hypothetical protein
MRKALALTAGIGKMSLTVRVQSKQPEHQEDEGVTVPEDLMKKHGDL